MYGITTMRSFVVCGALLSAVCLVLAAPSPLAAAKQNMVGIIVSNSINSKEHPIANLELRVNGNLIASGNVRYHNSLWSGQVPKGSTIHLTVRWNGIVQQRAIVVKQNGTYIGPTLTKAGKIKITF